MGVGGVSNEIDLDNNNSLPRRYKELVLCIDGYVKNLREIRSFLINEDYSFYSESEAEAFVKLFFYNYRRTDLKNIGERKGLEALKNCMTGCEEVPEIRGEYSILALTPDSILACVSPKKCFSAWLCIV